MPKKDHNDTTNKLNKGNTGAGDIGKAGHKSAASGGPKGQDDGLAKSSG